MWKQTPNETEEQRQIRLQKEAREAINVLINPNTSNPQVIESTVVISQPIIKTDIPKKIEKEQPKLKIKEIVKPNKRGRPPLKRR